MGEPEFCVLFIREQVLSGVYSGCLIVVDGNYLLTVLDFMAVYFVLIEECTIATKKSLFFCRNVISTMFCLKQ